MSFFLTGVYASSWIIPPPEPETTLFPVTVWDALSHGTNVPIGNGPLLWEVRQAEAPERLTIYRTTMRGTHPSMRVICLRNDDEASGNRAEIAFPQDAAGGDVVFNRNSGVKFFALSVFLPTAWQNHVSYHHVWQGHEQGGGHGGAQFGFAVTNRWNLQCRTGLGDFENAGAGFTSRVLEFSDNTIVRNAWTDWIIEINFTGDANGYYKVYRRPGGTGAFTQVLSWTGYTLMLDQATGEDRGFGLRLGVYRANEPPNNDTNPFDTEHYVSPFVVSNTWNGALTAFG